MKNVSDWLLSQTLENFEINNNQCHLIKEILAAAEAKN